MTAMGNRVRLWALEQDTNNVGNECGCQRGWVHPDTCHEASFSGVQSPRAEPPLVGAAPSDHLPLVLQVLGMCGSQRATPRGAMGVAKCPRQPLEKVARGAHCPQLIGRGHYRDDSQAQLVNWGGGTAWALLWVRMLPCAGCGALEEPRYPLGFFPMPPSSTLHPGSAWGLHSRLPQQVAWLGLWL